MTGAVLDNSTGLLSITPTQYNKLQSLFVKVGGATYEITKNAQTLPRSLNTVIGGNSTSFYIIIGDMGSNGGEGLDIVLGQFFLQRFYAVFDRTDNRVGLATTPFTMATIN